MMVGKIDVVELWVILKIVLALALGGLIFSGLVVRPPRRTYPQADLRVVVLAAFGLYGVGLVASLSHHVTLAMVVYATGIAFSTFAAWLSRGSEPRRPPSDENPSEPPPPDGPGDHPLFDWTAFEHQFRAYAHRHERPLSGTR